MSRLALARTRIGKDAVALREFRGRLAGHIEGALLLIDAASADALENLRLNPNCAITKQAAIDLATATQLLDPMVSRLCPLTAVPKDGDGIGGTDE